MAAKVAETVGDRAMIILPEWLLTGLQFAAIMGFIYSLGPLVSWWINREERPEK
jgi:hypothetical protein